MGRVTPVGDHDPPCVCDCCWSGAIDGAIATGLRARLIASFDAPPRRHRKVSGVSRKVSRVSVGRQPVHRRVDVAPVAQPDLVQEKTEPPPTLTPPVVEPAAVPTDLVQEAIVSPPREPRRRPPRKVAPAAPPIADVGDEPSRVCRVCDRSDVDGWSQADLCSSPACLSAAARHGRDVAAARRAPDAASAKRLRAIARFAGRLDRRAAAAERAADPIADVGVDDEDLVERLDRVPEVDDV